MKKILFIAAHRAGRSPGQRFRFEQYLSFLEQNQFSCELSYLLSVEDDKILYSTGNYLSKFRIWLKSRRIRERDVKRADKFDIIFIQREAFMTGSIKYERVFSRSKAKVIFDFDDSVWIENVSNANKKLAWLKNNNKTKRIIEISDMVFAGNQYLANYASRYSDNIKIVPTTIDTDRYRNKGKSKLDRICIGWTGSVTTIQHFECALPFLREVRRKFGQKIEIKVIGDGCYRNDELGIQGIPWSKDTELTDLSTIDIGIMPLPDDEWAKGKCGLKGLQYMALGIPTIMSPVGVNNEIIDHGENGFLADGVDEWVEILTDLIKSESLRNSIGVEAGRTVEKKYSVRSQQNRYLEYFQEIISSQ